MRIHRSIAMAGAGTAALLVMLATPASAHNAGHFWLPDGSCHNVGSFKDAPMIGPEDNKTQLDLVPETPNPPFDEYGTSFVGYNGQTPIFPGGCPS
jgi:hypothetical protein